MLNHLMMLYEDAFEKMKRGTKTIEIRLSDEKRRKVAVGDLITFRKSPKGQESLTVIVRDLFGRPFTRSLTLFAPLLPRGVFGWRILCVGSPTVSCCMSGNLR